MKKLIILIAVTIVLIFYLSQQRRDKDQVVVRAKKSSNDDYTKTYLKQEVANKFKKTQDKRQGEEVLEYREVLGNYLAEFVVDVDEDGTDWRSIHEDWFEHVKISLEDIGITDAKATIKKYLLLRMEHAEDEIWKILDPEYEDSVKKYIESGAQGNRDKTEWERVKKEYEQRSKKRNEIIERQRSERDEVWGDQVDFIKRKLAEFNTELETKYTHLNYKVGLGL